MKTWGGFTTPIMARAGGKLTPDFRLDNGLSLQEQYNLAIHEERFEDVRVQGHRPQDTIVEQSGLQQELDLSVKDHRWDDAIRFRDTMRSQTKKRRRWRKTLTSDQGWSMCDL